MSASARGAGSPHDRIHFIADKGLQVLVKIAYRPLEYDYFRYNISRVAAAYCTYRNNSGFQRIDRARHNGLYGAYGLSGSHYGIGCLVWLAAVAGLAPDRHHEAVCCRHCRSGSPAHYSETETAPSVEREGDVGSGNEIEKAFADEGLSSADFLLSRLKDETHIPREFLRRFLEHLSGSQKHRGMAVVAAGVGLAGDGRTPVLAGGFFQRQRIDICAKQHGWPRHLSPEETDSVGPDHWLQKLDFATREEAPNKGHSLLFLEFGLRERVNLVPDLHRFRKNILDPATHLFGKAEVHHVYSPLSAFFLCGTWTGQAARRKKPRPL